MAYPIQPTFHDCGTVYHTDLLTLCGELARRGMRVDMILMDLPYGQTAAKWDAVISFPEMWMALKRIITPNGAMVFTASGMFAHELAVSNKKDFRHEWVWNKRFGSNRAIVKYQPMRIHEYVLVFSQQTTRYTPQMIKRDEPIKLGGNKNKSESSPIKNSKPEFVGRVYEWKFPESILHYSIRNTTHQHPTEKPQALFEYLIRTYTKYGDVVFDGVVGSGTTAAAARATGRRFIVGDSSAEYVQVTRDRLDTPYTPSFMPTLEQAG